MKRKMTPSVKKFIRREKARIRSQIFGADKQKEEIKKLYIKVAGKNNEDK